MEDFQLFARLMEHEISAVTEDGHVRIEAEDNGCFAVYFSEALLRAIETLPPLPASSQLESFEVAYQYRADEHDHSRF